MSLATPEGLKKLLFFSGWSFDEVQIFIDTMDEINFSKGEKLTEEGKHGKHCEIILEGEVSLSRQLRGEMKKFSTLKAGDMIGEISFFRNVPQNATGIAIENGSCLRITQEIVKKLKKENSAVALKFFESGIKAVLDRFKRLSLELENIAFWF